MIESFSQRPAVHGGPAATPPDPAREKIVHRPSTRVNAIEEVDKYAQVGPRPAFRLTYLERAAAFWPEDPDSPVTRVTYGEARKERPVMEEARNLTSENTPPKIDIRR